MSPGNDSMNEHDEREIIQEASGRLTKFEGMRLLIGVVSCARDRESHELIRQTWAKDSPVAVRFFVGRDCPTTEIDEIALDVPDDWNGLPAKVHAVCRWTLFHGYDFLFKCDTDSYVSIPRLMASGFERWHYMGGCGETENVYPDACFPANGGGYSLSRRALSYLAEHMNLGLGKNCEDWCVFLSLMKGASIFVHHDARFRANRPEPGQGPSADNDFVILHDAGEHSLRNPELMIRAHEAATELVF
jgi:hypothetical protein